MDSNERELLEDIQEGVHENTVHAARTDERTKSIQSDLDELKSERLGPLEKQVSQNTSSTRQTKAVLGGLVSVLTLIAGGLMELFKL